MTGARGPTVRFAVLLLAALAVAGCGKKADLELPEGTVDRFPRTYPKPQTATPPPPPAPESRPPQLDDSLMQPHLPMQVPMNVP